VDLHASGGQGGDEGHKGHAAAQVYEKFDYNDLECQKKLICEVMREPDYFGNMSEKMKSGFQ
jgi:hypothetical protein